MRTTYILITLNAIGFIVLTSLVTTIVIQNRLPDCNSAIYISRPIPPDKKVVIEFLPESNP